ncbi:MAG: mandelate racemase/muconate lactonizing enzyme family protein [Saprospiraceae bacterium]|nr:mandelate racemase/muconate lactonizing enzyme family protein [Saprospiraceae bacterium]
MIIQQIEFFEVRVPALPDAVASKSINKPLHKLPVGASEGWSVQFDVLPKVIIKLSLKNGIIGWGECYRDHNWTVLENISKILLGRHINTISLQHLPFAFCREYDGFECALHDAYARAHDMRVVDLLGGPLREKIRVGAWSSHREKEEIPDLARKFRDMGFDCIKFKADLEDDVVAWCESIKVVDENLDVILDPNERWETAGNTRKRLHQLGEIGNVLCLEDPVPRWKLNEFALLKAQGLIPIVLHVSLPYIIHGQRIKDAIQALELNAVDGFNFNCGLANFQRLDHIAHAAGFPCWHGSEVDLGILEAMYLHSCAAAASCHWPSDIFGRLIREHDLLKQPLKIEPPFAYLPDGLGLGIEPDMDAIRNYQTDYKAYRA